jgi:hypothetical protein
VAPPLVSVVIPTWQRRDVVLRAVASARAQTCTDFEIIVVDDGSTDGTRETLERADGLVYRWQENAGVSAARNTGIRLARGAIVAFLDSDNFWLPGHLAAVTEVLSRWPEAVLCTTSPRFHIGGRQPPAAARLVDALPTLFAENIVGRPSGIAVRQEALAEVGGFDERLRVMEGWELWLRLAALGPFAFLQRRTFISQATRGSLTARSGPSGDYVKALSIVAQSASAIAARSRRADSVELRARAEGLAAYLEALHALSQGDAAAMRGRLGEACARLPELSREPQLVANRMSLIGFAAVGRLRAFEMPALTWPDAGADAALYLRLHALAFAVLGGRAGTVLRLLRGWPVAETPRFIARNAAVFARLASRRFQRMRHHGRERVPATDRTSVPGPAAIAEGNNVTDQ